MVIRARSAARFSPQRMEASAMTTVLVVDDHVEVRAMLRRLLERQQHTVLEAADAAAAMDVLRAAAVSVALIDRRLPSQRRNSSLDIDRRCRMASRCRTFGWHARNLEPGRQGA